MSEVTQKQRSFKDFSYMAEIMFKSLGYDLMGSVRPRWQSILMRCYFVLCVISSLYESIFVTYRILEWESVAGSPSKVMRQGLHFFYMFSAQVKFFTFMVYRKKLKVLINNLKDLYPMEVDQRRQYDVNSFFFSRTTRSVMYFYYLVMILMAFHPLLQSCIMFAIGIGKSDFLYLRIFPTRLSFDSQTPKGYILAYIIDLTYSQFIVNVSLGTDLWMMCVSSQISMHFAFLAKILASYLPNRKREHEDLDFLANLVRRHQVFLSLQKDVNQIFGLLLASNLFTTASLLCCMAFYSVVQGFNIEGISYLMLFFSVTAQFYMVSSYGQMLIDVSTKIGAAAYEQKWYEGSISYMKDTLFIMARSQRPSEISARGIIIISFDTFKTLMTITYRFFAVMRQTVGK
ncbi:odorant receptor 49a [Drosophila bipectinata]|uniref:odorant receptor 49a n=1 Tax=Drosophila bipectinata TaxID=42026 RepID=UPI001C8A3180|nr:odorant receptor 49a [Drosophila bipectinata]